MKLTIDTKEDSHDDIRRVIKMLQNLVGDSSGNYGSSSYSTNDPYSSSSPSSEPSQAETSSLFGMFGDSPSTALSSSDSSSSEPQQQTSTLDPFGIPDVSSLAGAVEDSSKEIEEPEEKIPDIIPY